MKNRFISFSMFVLLMLMFGCTDDDAVNGIDQDLQIYFDRFTEEALDRGLVVNFDSIPVSARITAIPDLQIAGTCLRTSNSVNEIEISGIFWESGDDFQREFVVFHELGHCYLNREHLEFTNPDGTCLSIMASGTGTCLTNYNEDTRSDYLDELFGL